MLFLIALSGYFGCAEWEGDPSYFTETCFLANAMGLEYDNVCRLLQVKHGTMVECVLMVYECLQSGEMPANLERKH